MSFLSSQKFKKDFIKLAIILVFSFFSFFLFGIGDTLVESDSINYVSLADNILENNRFSMSGELTNYREPAYPFFLSSVFSVFGKDNFLAAEICQWILFFIFIVCSYFVFKKYFKSEKVVFFTILLLSAFPSFAFYNGKILSESFYITLFGFLILALIDIYFKDFFAPWWEYSLLGALLGLMMLVKVSTIAIVPFVFLFILSRLKWKQALLSAFIMIAIIFPWSLRNFNNFGSFSITDGRQEMLYFAAGKVINELSPGGMVKRAFLRVKKGFQADLSLDEINFLDKYNEFKIMGDNGDMIEFMKENPDYDREDFRNYFLSAIFKNPLSAVSNISLNMISNLGPEIPTVVKDNIFLKDKIGLKKIFYVFYLFLYLFIYFVIFVFLIKILRFKKENILFYLFYLISFSVLLAYSLIEFSTRFNTPLFILYIFLLGFYFDRKIKERETLSI